MGRKTGRIGQNVEKNVCFYKQKTAYEMLRSLVGLEMCINQEDKREYLLLSLKYTGKSRNSVISEIKRISKPGLRVYANSKELPKVLDHLGIAIISTSKGVMTNLKAKELIIGGEVLCHIW